LALSVSINIRINDIYVFFFFQAEDGIRDRNVTGVQTCALPISANWESYASAISALLSTSRSPRSPATWHCCVKAGYCWTASKVSGFITAYHRIFQHGRRKLLMRPGDVNRKRFRRLSATWLDKKIGRAHV